MELKNIELARPGVWQLASGKTTFSVDHLKDAADFYAATGGQAVPLALGHNDPRFSGDPAFGSVRNVRYEEDDRGPVLKGDLVDMPGWLHAAAPKRWPNRSIEGYEDFEYGDRKYKLVLTGLALLGATPPGVMNIQSLQDLQMALAASAARRIVASAPVDLGEMEEPVLATASDSSPVTAKYDPHQPRDPGGENGGQWTDGAPGVGGIDPLGVADSLSGGPDKFVGSVRAGSDPNATGVNIVATEYDGDMAYTITTGTASQARSGDDHADDFSILADEQIRKLQPKLKKAITAAENGQPFESKLDGEDNGDVIIGAKDGKVTVSARSWGWDEQEEEEDLRPPLQSRDDFESEQDPDDDDPYTYEQYLADHAAGVLDDEMPEPVPATWKTAELTVSQAQELLSDVKRLAAMPVVAAGDRERRRVKCNPEHLAKIKARIRATPKRYGVEVQASAEPPPDPQPEEPPEAPAESGASSYPAPDAVHAAATETTTASPAGEDKQEGAASMDTAKLREALGLAPDVSDEEVRAALVTAGLAPPAADLSAQQLDQRVAANAARNGLITIDPEQLQQFQDGMVQAATYRKELEAQRRDTAIEKAIQEGKFTPARREHYEKSWDADPTGTRELINSLAAGLVPVTAMGYSTDVAEDPMWEAEFSKLFSKEVSRG